MKQYLIDLWKHPRYSNDDLKKQIHAYEAWQSKVSTKYRTIVSLCLILGTSVAVYVSMGNDGYIHPKILPTTIVSFSTAISCICLISLFEWFAEKSKPNTVVIEVYKDDLRLLADQLNIPPDELEQMDPQVITETYVAPRRENLQNFIDNKMRQHQTAPVESDRLEKLNARSERFQLLPKQ